MLRINLNAADIRKKGKFKSERRSQALYNEPVELIKKGIQYSLLKFYDGFRGYANNLFFSEVDESADLEYVIKIPLAAAFSEPDPNAPVLTLLPFSAKLMAVPEDDNFVKSISPRYGDIYLKCEDLILGNEMVKLTKERIPELISCAKSFIGVPYLWGGRTFFGVDCSGFVAVIYKYFGIVLPRKSKEQSAIGRSVNQYDIRPGDLLYFRKHVGIALSKYEYLHASLSQGGVHINTLNPHRKGYLKYRDETLRAVRRMTVD